MNVFRIFSLIQELNSCYENATAVFNHAFHNSHPVCNPDVAFILLAYIA